MKAFIQNGVLILFVVILAVGGLGWQVWRRYYYPTSDTYFLTASKQEQYGVKYNERRRELGLYLVEEGWYTKTPSETPRTVGRHSIVYDANYWNSQIWSDFIPRSEPHHKEKELTMGLDYELSGETDRWEYRLNDSTLYLLEIHFSYLSNKRQEDPWTATLLIIRDKGDYDQVSRDLKKVQADSILTRWGL